MSPVAKQISDMVNCLPENEQLLVLEIVKRFVPDDIATPADIEDLRIADEEYARGEYVRFEDINWN